MKEQLIKLTADNIMMSYNLLYHSNIDRATHLQELRFIHYCTTGKYIVFSDRVEEFVNKYSRAFE